MGFLFVRVIKMNEIAGTKNSFPPNINLSNSKNTFIDCPNAATHVWIKVLKILSSLEFVIAARISRLFSPLFWKRDQFRFLQPNCCQWLASQFAHQNLSFGNAFVLNCCLSILLSHCRDFLRQRTINRFLLFLRIRIHSIPFSKHLTVVF